MTRGPAKPDVYREIPAMQLQANVALQCIAAIPEGAKGKAGSARNAALDYLTELLDIRKPERD